MNKVLKMIKSENQWPGIKGFRVEVEMPNGKMAPIVAEIFMAEELYKVHMFIQGAVETEKMNELQADALLNLIDDFGLSRYSEGYNEADMNAAEMAAGEDI